MTSAARRPPSAVYATIPWRVTESGFVGGVGVRADQSTFGFVWMPEAHQGFEAGMNETGSRPRITRVAMERHPVPMLRPPATPG